MILILILKKMGACRARPEPTSSCTLHKICEAQLGYSLTKRMLYGSPGFEFRSGIPGGGGGGDLR
jgi:hypothetical protein